MPPELMTLTHVFVDHSNIWGGARLAAQIKDPKQSEDRARVSPRRLDEVLHGRRQGVSTKIVSGGIPPGMEGLWAEYEASGYNTQRLYRGKDWKERGVDHSIIGHMWRLLTLYRDTPTILVLASGDGKKNEFGTSFVEVLEEVLRSGRYPAWKVELASFDWKYPDDGRVRSPTAAKVRHLVESSKQGQFTNLLDHYKKIVYFQKDSAEWIAAHGGTG
jgi:hypothetical protein